MARLLTAVRVPVGPTDIALSNSTIAGNAAAGTTVGAITGTGGTAPLTFTVVAGADASKFTATAFKGATNLNTTAAYASGGPYSAATQFDVGLRATDAASATFDKSFTITAT